MKKRLKLVLAILAALAAVLLVLALLGKFVFGWFDTQEDPVVLPDLEAGESYYYLSGSPVKDVVLMFPQLSRADLCEIKVHNTKGENYFFFHNQASSAGYFVLGQCKGESWEWTDADLYYPPILEDAVGSFDYTSLYDNTSTIPAMLATVGAVNIAERIKPEGDVDFDTWLSQFGLAKEDDPAYFELVTYLRDKAGNYLYTVTGEPDRVVGIYTGDGKYYYIDTTKENNLGDRYTGSLDALNPVADTENTIRVYVGNPTIDDRGYYLYLEGREVVYTTQNQYLPDVVERNIGYYIYPRLVSQPENQYASQLTPNLSYWNGQHFGITSGATLTDDMTVSLKAPVVWEVDSDNDVDRKQEDFEFKIDLSGDVDSSWQDALLGAVLGVGSFDTILWEANLYEGTPGTAVTYTIYGIEGVLRNGKYQTEREEGILAGDHVVLRYSDGRYDKEGNPVVCYGYVPIGPSTPTALASLLVGCHSGDDFGTGKTLTLTYGEDAPSYTIRMEFLSLDGVMTPDGKEGKTVTYGSTIRVTYSIYEVDTMGRETALGTVSPIFTIPLEEDYNDPAKWEEKYGYLNAERQMYTMQSVFNTLLGKSVGEFTNDKGNSTLKLELVYPVEAISDFVLYRDVTSVSSVQYELELSIGHTNYPDVYYGSSIYEVLAPAEKALYGLDGNATATVIELFGDLYGKETVALGLTDQVMEQYGLYAYRLYYELPYNIYTVDDGDLTHYFYRNKVGYYLHISDKQADGSRYIASEQFDIVVKYEDGSQFDFLDWDFYKNWIQNNMVMAGYQDLRQMVFDINWGDYKHIWGLDICVDREYLYEGVGANGSVTYTKIPRLYASLIDGGTGTVGNTYQDLIGIIRYKDTYFDYEDYTDLEQDDPRRLHTTAGKFVRYYSDTQRSITELENGTNLDLIYRDAGFTEYINNKDFAGAYYTKTILQLLNSTHYAGTVEDDLRGDLPQGVTGEEADRMVEERLNAILADESKRVLTLALALDDGDFSYGYVFRFYNYSTHSLVSISKVGQDGQEITSSVFYIQAREVARLTQAVISLTQGKEIDIDKL